MEKIFTNEKAEGLERLVCASIDFPSCRLPANSFKSFSRVSEI